MNAAEHWWHTLHRVIEALSPSDMTKCKTTRYRAPGETTAFKSIVPIKLKACAVAGAESTNVLVIDLH
jgi:hypothetical protein